MTLRTVKVFLMFGLALLYTLVVFNNVTDYDSNYQFVRHVMMMDTTFDGNRGMWRAMNSPAMHTTFYVSIIAWEALTMLLCWVGGAKLALALRGSAPAFHRAKRVAIAALTLGLLQWLVVFLAVGAEWFLMWQSKSWNGQEAGLRMFMVVGITLVILMQPDSEEQP